MELFIDLLKITIPSLIVFLTAYFVLKKFMENQDKQRKFETQTENKKIVIPVRLQAYERVVMFLERISPDSIIMRYSQTVKTAQELQTELLSNIRAEYEHNISQQIYMSSRAWEMVKNAKGNLIQLISSSAENIDGKAPALNLSQAILEKVIEMKKSPVFDALEFIKKEVQELLD